MSQNLDKTDRKLLYHLDCNARLSLTQLGKLCRISKQVAKYRIQRLEQQQYIKGYYAMIDTSALGYITFRTYLKFRNATNKTKENIINYCKAQPHIWAVVQVAGKWDLALGICVHTHNDYHNVWEAFLAKHLEHISNYATCIYAPIYHYTKQYLVEDQQPNAPRIIGDQQATTIDTTDNIILQHLAKNARIPTTHIATQTGLTAEAVSYRMRQLEKKNIIKGYRAMIAVEKLGIHFFKAEIRLSSYKHIKQIIEFCHHHPNIYQVDKTIGGETLEIEFHVPTLQKMIDIIADIEKQFPQSIEQYTYLTVLSEEKTTYMPVE